MAVSFGSQGAGVAGTTSIDVAYPASIAAGNMLVAFICTKYPGNAPPAPSGWTLAVSRTGGAGASGVDSGDVDIRMFTKIADGTETGTVTFANAGANCMSGRMARFTKAAAKNWDVSTGFGSQNTATASWSVSTTLTDVTGGDVVFSVCGVNSNVNTFSAEAITATGLTVGTETERTDAGTASGDDAHLVAASHVITAGPATSIVTFTMTSSGSSTNEPAGAVVLLRLREANAYEADPGGIASAESFGSPELAHAVDSGSAASAEAFGTPVLEQVIHCSGIASAESVPSPHVVLELGIGGIASLESFGTPVFELLLAPSSIASAEVVPSPTIVLLLDAGGIASAEAFGTPALAHAIDAISIASLEAFGAPNVVLLIDAGSIASAESVPTHAIDLILGAQAIASAEAFGTATIESTAVIFPASIETEESFGTPSLADGVLEPRTTYVVSYLQRYSALGSVVGYSATAGFKRTEAFVVEVD